MLTLMHDLGCLPALLLRDEVKDGVIGSATAEPDIVCWWNSMCQIGQF